MNENRQLAMLAHYLLESKDWTCVWLSEYSEPMRLFTYKTGIPYREAKKYIDNAMDKLLGDVYFKTQKRLMRKTYAPMDLLYKPKRAHNSNERKPKKSIAPRTEFGKKYLEKYGYGASENLAQYQRERKHYLTTGKCSWETT